MNRPNKAALCPPTTEQLIQKAARYCARAERSSMQVCNLLKRNQASAIQISEVIKTLTEQGFINDERFATAFARDKHKFNSWGKQRIVNELKLHKIPSEQIAIALDLLEEECDISESAKQLMTKKASTLKNENRQQAYGKLMRYGLYRGYEYDMLASIVDELLKERFEHDD